MATLVERTSGEVEAGLTSCESRRSSADVSAIADTEQYVNGAYMAGGTEIWEADMLHWAEGKLLGFDLETTGTD